MGTAAATQTGPVINYAEVVGDLRSRAASLIEAATILEGFMGVQERTVLPVQPAVVLDAPAAVPVKRGRKKASNFEEFLERKKATQPASNQPTLMSAVFSAIEEAPRTPAELTARVLQLRPGTNIGEIPKTAYSLKQRDRIEKRGDRWCVRANEREPVTAVPVQKPKPSAPHLPQEKQVSIRDLIRHAIAENKNRNADEIVERVQHFRPGLPKDNVKTQVSQLVIEGEACLTVGGWIEPVNLKLPTQMNGAAH